MKAIVNTVYGSPDVLKLKEVAQPVPKANEVLIKVHAASVNSADLHLLKADPFLARLGFGLFKPKTTILGADVAGRVEAVGNAVTKFKPGDAVFGDLAACGFGTFAEYVCAREDALVLKPANLSFEQAAAVPMAAVTALMGLRDKGHIQAGQKVLVLGASGGVGMFAVQIARALGAEVTGVCSTQKMAMVRAIGADHVVDYTKADVTQNGQHYDLIFDAAAYRSFKDYKPVLSPTGTYVLIGGSMSNLVEVGILGGWHSKKQGQTFTSLMAHPNAQDLATVKAMLEAGQVKPAIDRCYPLSEVPDALRHVDARRVQGKVVIAVARDPKE